MTEIEKRMYSLYRRNFNFVKISKFTNTPLHKVKRFFYKRLNLKSNVPSYSVNQTYFDIIDNSTKAYILGFIYADGCISISTKGYTLIITLHNKDIDLLLLIKNALNYTGGLFIENNSTYNRVTLRINNKYLVNSLITQGCFPNKSFILKRPDLNKSFVKDFIRGYFDGDGCIHKDYVYILGTYDICEYIHQFCNTLNITSYIRERSNIYRLEIGGRYQTKIFLDAVYNESTIHLDRKYIKYLNILNNHNDKIKKCKIESCMEKHKAFNYCQKHYYIYKKALKEGNFFNEAT